MAVAPDKKTTRSESQTKIDTLRAKIAELKARVEELETENLALKKFAKPSGATKTPTTKPATTTASDTKSFFAKQRAIAEMDATAKAKKAAAEKNRRFKQNAADAKPSTPTGKKSKPKSKFFDNSPGLQAKRDSRNAAKVAARPRPKSKVK
jgi:phage shock protein A